MPRINISGQIDGWFRFSALQLDEFVPIILLDSASFITDKIASCLTTIETVELSDKIVINKRKIKLVSIVTSPGDIEIPFKVSSGLSTLDTSGCLTPRISTSSADVKLSPNGPTQVELEKIYTLKVSISGNGKKQFLIDFFADDNVDDFNQGEFKNVFCGRIEICVFPDVFSKYEHQQLIDEINFIQPLADAGSPSEYAGNYCMSAAERGLSLLLGDTTDFYSVDRSHNRMNTISFSGKGAKDRGDKFKTNGYVFSNFTFSGYQVDHNLRIKTKSDADFSTNMYNVVTLNSGSKLQEYLKNSIKDKPGFHVYYISVSDDFHTLLLSIDNRNAENISYAIYDQHGLTSSSGAFSHIEAGFARQTSWTFLNFYANQGYRQNLYGGVTTRLWKIQRKL